MVFQHQPIAGEITPPVDLDELLDGLRLAWPASPIAEAGFAALDAYARDRVRRYYGAAVYLR